MTAVAVGATAFPGVPLAVSRARAYVATVLDPHGVDGHDAALMVSELFTNAIVHGGSAGGVVGVSVYRIDDTARVEVIDEGGGMGVPVLRENPGESGRGLRLVASYAQAWGWEHRGRGATAMTVVWFEMPAGG